MPQPKKPVAKKAAQKADNTRVSKVIKQPGVGPNYSEFNKSSNFKTSKPNSLDTADYKAGYRKGISNARSGKLVSPDKKGNPKQAWYPFRTQGGIPLAPGRPETMRYAEGRFEGEKRGKKK
jgi:hypothetical protein